MANKKITELDAVTTLASTDVVLVVDVSADTTNKITTTNLFRTLPDGTAAAPALAFSSDQANGVYLAGTDTVGISTGGTQRVTVDGSGNVTISGDLTVSGATTTVESTTVTIDDKNIELGSVATPTNTTADGGGITLKGATDKTLKWINSTGCWTFNQPMNFNDHVRIDSSGNVGVNTASPQTNLDIAPASSSATLRVHARSDSSPVPAIELVRGTTTSFGTDTRQDFRLKNSGGELIVEYGQSGTTTEALRVNSTGSVLVGTTDSTIYNNGDSDSEGIVLRDGEVVDIARKGDLQLTLNRQTNDGHHIGFFRSGSPKSYIATRNDGFCIDVNSSERLRIDSSGKVGIGETSVQSTLHVARNIADSDAISWANSQLSVATPIAGNSTANRATIYFAPYGSDNNYAPSAISATAGTSGASTLKFFTNASGNLTGQVQSYERMRIDSSGNVGIGVTPTSPLHVKHATFNTVALFESGDTQAEVTFKDNAGQAHVGCEGDALFFKTASSGTERLRIDSSGRVGIGSTAPGHNLEVKGSFPDFAIVDSDTTNDKFRILHNGGGTQLMVDPNNVGPNASYFLVSVDGSEKMRIDSSGRLGIGTTSPNYLLTALAGSGSQNIFQAGQTGVSNGYTISSNGSALTHQWYAGSGEAARIDSSGRLLIGTSTSPSGGDGHAQSAPLLIQGRIGNDADSGRINLQRGSAASSGSSIGTISFTDSSNNAYARLEVEADAATGSNDYPGRIKFSTTADGASSPTERLRIKSDGTLHAIKSGTQIANAEQTVAVFQRSSAAGSTSKISIVSGNAASSHINFGDTDDEDTGMIAYVHSTNAMQFHTDGNVERMRLDSSGRLLLGTTTVGQASADDFTIADSGDVGISIRSTSSNQTQISFSDGTSGTAEYAGQIAYDHTDDHMRFRTNAVERFRITSTGAWAIEGASNYGTSGQVLTSNGNDAPTWQDASGGGGSGDSISEGNTSVECVDTGSDGHITLDTEGVERIRVDNAGNVGINETSPATTGFGAALRVKGINGVGGLFAEGSSGNSWFGFYSGNSASDTPALLYPSSAGSGIRFGTTGGVGTAGFQEKARLDKNGNLLLGGSTTGNNAKNVLALFNGTAPSTSVTNGVVLYAQDVSSSSELKVRDEAGNVTTLSPHNFDLIPEGPSEDMAWSYYSEKDGKRINVDMLKAVRLLEQLTGEQLVFTG